MKQQLLFLLFFGLFASASADEGMWMVNSLEQIEPQLKALGFEMNPDEIYQPGKTSLKDAVVIFGPGCTGSLISANGLVATNHHCGYSGIHALSTVENNYLENGFWANNQQDEIPVPDLDVTFIEKIEDVTAFVLQEVEKDPLLSADNLFDPYTLNQLVYRYVDSDYLLNNPYVTLEIESFYNGNQFYLIQKKRYTDIRLVGTPPSSIGKFGGETDNWTWPRHTGDFALFRIYADSLGNPAGYNQANVPYKPKTYIPVSTEGFQENDFAFILGFPGQSSRYMTSFETVEEQNSINPALIRVRGELLKAIKEKMHTDDEIALLYADKYDKSANYYKNAIGVNQSLDELKVITRKKDEEKKYRKWAKTSDYPIYSEALDSIESKITKRANLIKSLLSFHEIFYQGVGFSRIPVNLTMLTIALNEKDELSTEVELIKLQDKFNDFQKDYNPDVDKAIAKRILPLFQELVEEEYIPSFFDNLKTEYNGRIDEYIDYVFETSIFGSRDNFRKFRLAPDIESLKSDEMLKIINSVDSAYKKLLDTYYDREYDCENYKKIVMNGVLLMRNGDALYPDANSTMRLTYGTVKSYNPSDSVKYDYYTTLTDLMKKENFEEKDFQIPLKLKELYSNNDFGNYALPDGDVPVCFITTNDITGGNSGSPVMNKDGKLTGIAFDGNWEAMSSDFIYEPELQRCIVVDIRYVLFVIEKFAENKYILNEIRSNDR